MPLVKNTLETELKKLLDSEAIEFVGFPADIPAVAENWANAIDMYAKLVVPISTTAALAKEAFKTVMLGINTDIGNGLALLQDAYSAYATALAAGMVGAGFVGVPPPVSISFAVIPPLGLGGASGKVIAELITNISDLWFRTGTATPVIGGPPVPWV
jgi:hypothetical protein